MAQTIIETAGTPDHPITVERAGHRVTLTAGGVTLAETEDALILREGSYPPCYYLPKSAVSDGFLQPATKVTHCPYKGDASHWRAVLADGTTVDPIAWSYETPVKGMGSIAGHLGFYTAAARAEFTPPAE